MKMMITLIAIGKKIGDFNCLSFCLLMTFMMLSTTNSIAQTNSYLGLNGGFEGTATIVNGTTNAAPVATNWTKSTTTATIANETATTRSGSNALKVTSTSATLCRVFSPSATIASSTTAWQVQYYRRATNTTNTIQNQSGNYRGGVEQTNGAYTSVSAANTWEKVTYSPTTTTSATTAALDMLVQSKGTGGDMFYDDFVLYESATVDNTAPSSATAATVGSATTSNLTVGWTAASGGVDGGGYMVVRYATNPNADNDPNGNGIYAVNNTITNGTGSLTGTVCYVGTATSFVDTGLTAGVTYYYKVYTYDKAYNYAAEAQQSGTTLLPTLTSFTPSNGCSGTSIVITGTNFTGATAVTFGGTAATSFTVNSSTQITAVVGAGASGAIAVTVAGVTTSLPGFTTSPPKAPTVTAGGSTTFCNGNNVALTAALPSVTDLSFLNSTIGTFGTDQWQSFVPTILGATTGITISFNGSVNASGTFSIYNGVGVSGSLVYSQATTVSGTNIDYTISLPNLNLVPGNNYTFRWQGANLSVVGFSSSYGSYFSSTYGLNPSWRLCFATTVVPTLGTYQWYNNASAIGGATTATYSASSAGSYTCMNTVASCSSVASNSINVTVNPLPTTPTITAGGATSICSGGSVTLTSSAGTTYLWSTGATTQSITVSTAGSYTVRVTDGNGCQSAASAATTVTVNPLPSTPTITAGGATTFCSGGSVTLTSSAGSSYLWSTGATTQSITVSTTGSYTVKVTNANGCQSLASTATTVTVNPLPTTPTITAGGATTFCSGGSVTLISSAGTSYLWSTGATTQSITVSTTGSYTVKVTNANGCQSVDSAATTVTVNPLPSTPTITGQSLICTGASGTLTSSAGTGYLWSTGATTQSITVSTGSYTVRVTDANGCQSPTSSTFTVSIESFAIPTITTSGPTTFCSGGSVTLTSSIGIHGGSYLWSTGAITPSITVSAAGSYTVQTVSSTLSCKSTPSAATTVVVNPLPAAPTITAGGSTTFCSGGSVTLTSSAGTGYLWSNGATTQSITVSTAGSYTVRVTDANSCQSAASAATSVTVNPLPASPTIAGGPVSICSGSTVTLTSSVGTAYLWSTGATSQSITVSSTGNYTVRVTDANGCQSPTSAATFVFVETQPTPTITASGPTTFCQGSSVTLTSSQGQFYLWSNGSSNQSITVSAAGNYSVRTKTSTLSCLSTPSATTTITVNPIPTTPTITAGGSTTFCPGGSVTLTSSAGTTYLWSTGATTQSITVSTAGSYTVRVTDANGCQSANSAATTTTILNDVTPPVLTCPNDITVNIANGQCGATVTFAATATDNCSTPILTYSPNSGAFFAAGTTPVTITATDNAGNTTSCSFTVTVNDTRPPVITCPENIYLENALGECTVPVTIAKPTVLINNCLAIAPVLDQSNLSINSNAGVTDGYVSQSFTSGYSGKLKQIDLSLMSVYGSSTGTLRIYDGGEFVDYLPTGALLYSQTISLTSDTFNTFVLDTPLDVVAGHQYTFRINNGGQISLPINNSNSYLGGQSLIGAYDFIFRTYISNGYTITNNFNNTSDASGTYGLGVTNVVWTATDLNGNTASCTQTVTVNKSHLITLTCPENVYIENPLGQCSVPVRISIPAVSVKSCTASEPLLDQSSLSSNSTAAVGDGYVSQTFTPGYSGKLQQIDLSLANINGGSLTGTLRIYDGGAYANYTPTGNLLYTQTIALSPNSFNTFVLDSPLDVVAGHQYTFRVNNGGSNFALPINSNNPYSGGQSAFGNWDFVFRTYITNGYTITNNFNNTPDASGTYSFGTTSVVWTATDLDGNTATCTQTVTVNDSHKPTLTCPDNIVISSICTPTLVVPKPTIGSSSLDQSNLSSNSYAGFGVNYFSQSFTAGISGLLNQIDIGIDNSSATGTLNIYDSGSYFAGLPTGNLVYSQPVTIAQHTINSFILNTPITVTNGNQYVFQLITDSGVQASFNSGDSYSGGGWIGSGDTDLVFRTYVKPSYTITNNITGTSDASGVYNFGTTNIIWTATDSCGNSTSCTQTVTVNNSPLVPTIAANGPTSFCPGGSVVLTASPANSYLWSNGATTQSITVNTSGDFTVQETNECTTGVSAATTVTINPLPTITISGPTSIACGDTVTLTANGADNYVWQADSSPSPIASETLDQVPTASLAIGLRKLIDTYNGPCVRLKRSTDGTEMNFGFTGNNLDKASIKSWLSQVANSQALCVRLYDQSGHNGDVLYNGESFRAPVLQFNSSGRPVLHFNTNQTLFNTVNYSTPYTVIYGAKQTGGSRQRVLSSRNNNWLLGYWSGKKDQAHYNGWVSNPASAADDNFYIYAGSGDGFTSQAYRDGSLLANNSGGLVGPNGIQLNGWQGVSYAWWMGNYIAESSDVDFTDVLVFNSVLTTTQRNYYENTIKNYYTTGSDLTVSPLNTTTYYVAGTSSTTGCSSTTEVTVTVNSNPPSASYTTASSTYLVDSAASIVPIVTGNGNTYTISPSLPTGMSLNTTTGLISGIPTVLSPETTYSITVENSCGSTTSTVTFATICNRQLPAITASSSTICPGYSVALTSSESLSNLWSTGETSQTIFVYSAGTYTVTSGSSQCVRTSDAITVQNATIPGDPSVFGLNEWKVYDFKLNLYNTTDNLWTNNYRGFYTIPTVDFSTLNQWDGYGAPSDAPGYSGCPVTNDNHAWSAKRQGFEYAFYSVDIDSHDDRAELWINNTKVWEDIGCCDTHANVWQGYLGVNDRVEFRVAEQGGYSNGAISFHTGRVPLISVSGSTALCQGDTVTLSAPQANYYLWSTGATTQSITVSTAGNYAVQISADGSTYTASSPEKAVIVNPRPEITIVGNTSIACGDSVLLTATGGDTYLWNTSNIQSPAPTKPLDQVANATLAVGLRKLKSTYNGPCVRLRRPTDGAQMDFGFVGDDLDMSSISAWLGGSTTVKAQCLVIYDQSGNGGSLFSYDADYYGYDSYPTLQVNAFGKPIIHFNSNQYLYNEHYYSPAYTAIYGANQTGGARGMVLSSTYSTWYLGYWNGAKGKAYFEGWVTSDLATPAADNKFYIYAGSSDGNSSQVYENGSLLANSAVGVAGPNGIQLNGAYGYSYGTSDVDFTDLMLFGAVLPPSDRSFVENSIFNYYQFNTASSVSVTPSTATTYSVTGYNSFGCGTTATITINPGPNVAYTNVSSSYSVGTTVSILPTVTTGIVTYSVTPALPEGLRFDTETGIISGSPSVGTPSTSYTVTVQNACGTASTTLTFATSCSTITTQPLSNYICGAVGSTTSYNVATDFPNATYIWQYRVVTAANPNPVWITISTTTAGAVYHNYNTATLGITKTATAPISGTQYRVIVSGSCGNLLSNAALLSIITSVKGGTISSATSVCAGSDITLALTNYVGTSFQWQSALNATSAFTAIPGATGASYTLTGVAETINKSYRVLVTNSCNNTTALSGIKTIKVDPPSISGSIVAGGGVVCIGGGGTLKINGNTGKIQWQYSTDGLTYINAPSAATGQVVPFSTLSTSSTVATYVISNISTELYFRVKVTSGTCSAAYTEPVHYKIGTTAVVGKVSAESTLLCSGTGTILTLAGATGVVTWQKSTNVTTPVWTSTTNQTLLYATGNLTVPMAYRAMVSIGTCSTVYSEVIIVNIVAKPVAKTIVKNTTSPSGAAALTALCITDSSKVLTVGAGYVGAVQWQWSTTSTTAGFTDIPGANSASYNIVNPSVGANYYRVKLSNSCGTLVYGVAVTVYYKDCIPAKAAINVPFSVIAYPSPYSENFSLSITTSNEGEVGVSIYDMTGKLIEKREVKSNEVSKLHFGDRYPSGVYNIIVTQGLEIKTLRVIKR